MTRQLIRSLGLIEATALVVGIVIGTGVFIKAATMTQYVGTVPWVMAAWVAAGLLSLAGALTYAELGSLFPRAGGEFIYVRETYGSMVGFLYGWMRFWVGAPGSIAAYAVGAVTFAARINHSDPSTRPLQAVLLVCLFSGLNCLKVIVGGRLQVLLTVLKIAMILSVTCLLFGWSGDTPVSTSALLAMSGDGSGHGNGPSFSQFGAAMLAALWAYDGWNSLPSVSGEIHDPQRNVGRALAIGMTVVMALYLGINYSYFRALSPQDVMTSYSTRFPTASPVSTRAVEAVVGAGMSGWLALAFVVSALGAMNGSILTGARVPYAMATEGLAPKRLATLGERSHVPVVSVILQGCVASLLAMTGTFDQLTDYVVFSSWIFYGAMGAALFIWRKRAPQAPRAFRVWGYPWVPIIFCAVAAWLVVNTLIIQFQQSMMGVGIIALGVPVYWIFFKKNGDKARSPMNIG